ncbi:MAG: SRPBCC family protein [Candidatus Geothermincolia bacterium]
MFKQRILTGIEISAGAERVWEVLTDLASYPEWNPMIRKASGELVVGGRLALHFEPAGQKGRDFRPRLLVVEPHTELRWLGNPGFPGMFMSEHYFILEPRGEGTTRLVHGMDCRGLAVPLLAKWAEKSSRGPFEEMNESLKERSEGAPCG